MKKVDLFDDLNRYLDDLEELLPSQDEFLAHKGNQYTISMLLLNIANACVDIGNEIITAKQLGMPTSYKDTFFLLEKSKIISPSLRQKMCDLVGIRNLLAHEYGEIDMPTLHEQAQNMEFVEEYIKKTITHF